MAAYGNTSSLLVTLDRITERLLPHPPVPRPPGNRQNQFNAGNPSPSHGFMDTNDERFLMFKQRLKRNFNSTLDGPQQADQPVPHVTTTGPRRGATLQTEPTDTPRDGRK